MTSQRRITIATDFSRFPAGRYRGDGPYSGEACRGQVLVPALKGSERVIVNLDGTLGFGSSFLEEAFGGLVREEGFSASDLHGRLTLEAADRTLVSEIWSYVDDAGRRHTE